MSRFAALLAEVFSRWDLKPGWLIQAARELNDAIPALERRLLIQAVHELHDADTAIGIRVYDLEADNARLRDRRKNRGDGRPPDSATENHIRFGVALLKQGVAQHQVHAALLDLYASTVKNPREPARKVMEAIRARLASQQA